MKTWISKFRISAAFDKGKPFPRWLSRRLSASEELRSFASHVSELDSALRRPGSNEIPVTLHASIMGAIRASNRAANAPRRARWLRWLPFPATAVFAVCAVCWLCLPQSSNRAVPSLTDAFQVGEQITDILPGELVDPLNEEWQRVNLDLENTSRFLLAAVPLY
jgi:hypothetical protein